MKSFSRIKSKRSATIKHSCKQIVFYLFGIILILSSCSPKISTTVSKTYPAIDFREEIKVYDIHDPVPVNAEKIGVLKIGDSGFSVNCSWEKVINDAKIEARKIGGNAIKITKHKLPNPLGSSCHRISAEILRIDNTPDFSKLSN